MIKHLSRYRPWLGGALWSAVEALPLPVFLVCMQVTNPVVSTDWRTTYFLSTAVAFATTYAVWRRGIVLNRLYMALNLYFASGSVGLLLPWRWLNQRYGELEATAMFVWVVSVGVLCTFFTNAGFIGVVAERQIVTRASFAMLGVAVLLTAVSWRFLGNDLLAAYVPFVVLFGVYALLRSRARRAAKANLERP